MLGFLLLLSSCVSGEFCRAATVNSWPESREDRQALFAEDAKGTAVRIDSLLAHVPSDDADHAFIQQIAIEHAEATGDSLLIWDSAFCADLSLQDRQRWWRAVQQDAEGFVLRSAREFEASAEAFHQAGETYRALGAARRLAVVLGSRGVSLWYLGDLDVVRQAYEEALAAREALGDQTLIGRTQNALGTVVTRQGDYPTALEWFAKARATREGLGNTVDLGTTLSYIGNVHFLMGNLEQARVFFDLAVETLGEDAPARRINSAQMGLANVHNDLGEYEAAIALYDKQVRASEEAQDDYRAALNKSNMGNSMRSKGDYANAMRQLQEAIAIFDTLGEGFHEASALNSLGGVYEAIGNYPEAIRTFRKAEDLARQFENIRGINNAISNIGFVYYHMGLLEKALEEGERGIEAARAANDSLEIPSKLAQIGDVYKKMGTLEQALDLYEQALQLSRQYGQQGKLATRLVDYGNSLSSVGRYDEARTALREAIELAEESIQLNVLWGAWLGLGDTFERDGQLHEARRANTQAIAIAERMRARELTERQRATLLERSAFAYEAQVHVLSKLDTAEPGSSHDIEAFAVAEEGKARSLLDVLSEGRVDFSANLPAELAQDIQTVERQLATLRYQIRQADGSTNMRQLRKQLSGLESQRQQLEARARLEHPRLATLHSGQPTTVDEVRSVLLQKKNTALFEYSLGDSASYLWVITNKSTELYPLPPRGDIEPQVHALRSALSSPLASGDATLVSSARGLYDMLLLPAAAALDKVKHIYLVPDGALQFLPFDVLLEKDPKPLAADADSKQRNRWLGKLPYALAETQVLYGPSASTLVVLSQQSEMRHAEVTSRSLFALGDPLFHPDHAIDPQDENAPQLKSTTRSATTDLPPLPYSRAEVEAIGALFAPEERVILLGAEARESTVRTDQYLRNFDILHFATHGLVDERRPERSSLVLSYPQDDSEDGHLQASEIYALQLQARLVVLSACETGLGRMLRGEGVLGLPRAFLYAGASSVVMSFWSVSDRSTSELMQEFYTKLIKKKRAPAKALVEAKKEMRASDEFAHPFFWSPFVILGASSS